MVKKIGILALQGNFQKHKLLLNKLGLESNYVRYASDLDDINGLIIPGGESTTMTKLLNRSNLYSPIKTFAKKYPVLGTCAGLIMMSDNAMDERVKTLKLLNINVERNASGRQINSSAENISVAYQNIQKKINVTFIRAPKIKNQSEAVQVLGTLKKEPVMI